MGPAAKLRVEKLSAWYGDVRALDGVSFELRGNSVTALIGPSGCGKSTLLRCLNRMIETRRGGRMSGRIVIDGEAQSGGHGNLTRLRRRFGVVAQQPDLFPKSVRENVVYGPKVHKLAQGKRDLDAIVRRMLMRVGLWDELEHELDARAHTLSLGQQQRLCIARALAYAPEMMLMDEPCSQLDEANAARVEDLAMSLRSEHTVIWATHDVNVARRIADDVVVLEKGSLVRCGPAREVLADST